MQQHESEPPSLPSSVCHGRLDAGGRTKQVGLSASRNDAGGGTNHPSVERLRRTLPQYLGRYRRATYPVDAVPLYGLYTDNADIGNGEAEILQQWNQAFEFPNIVPATDGDYYEYLSENFSNRLPTYKGDGGSYWEDGAGSTAAMTAQPN